MSKTLVCDMVDLHSPAMVDMPPAAHAPEAVYLHALLLFIFPFIGLQILFVFLRMSVTNHQIHLRNAVGGKVGGKVETFFSSFITRI